MEQNPAKSALPTKVDDLIFPEPSQNWSRVLSDIKHTRLSIRNRLASILQDAAYAQEVAEHYGLPLIANERCGSWYVPPEQRAGSVYFKSTDGHTGQWSFSLRRLNLHVLDVIDKHRGCIIVDSTRRGKSMPDALSKTIPIWIAIFNRLLFPDAQTRHRLRTSPEVVARSEHAQIESRLDGFVARAQGLNLDLDHFRGCISAPLVPYFAHQGESLPQIDLTEDVLPVICCSVSRREIGDGDPYIQGGGDDTENWAHALTADLFWRHQERLSACSNDEELIEIIESTLGTCGSATAKTSTVVKWTGHSAPLHVSNSEFANSKECAQFDAIILCNEPASTDSSSEPSSAGKPLKLCLGCKAGRLGSRDLRHRLHLVSSLMEQLGARPKILVACDSGDNLAIGVALAILCQYYDPKGNFSCEPTKHVNKVFVRERLARLLETSPSFKPSRATLQSVNAFLMSGTQ